MKNLSCCWLLIILLIALVAYFKTPKSADKPPVDIQHLEELPRAEALKMRLSDSLILHHQTRDSLQQQTIKHLHHENTQGPVPPVYLAAPADSLLREFLRRTS